MTGQHVTVLIPAHNEEATVGETVRCLRQQHRSTDHVYVVADNCSDDTALEADRAGAEVRESVDNKDMKAGALNQVLSSVLPAMEPSDVVIVMDADTLVTPEFVGEAITAFERDPHLGGVSGVYDGKPGGGWVGWCQRNEFARWGFDGRQQQGKAICLSGACSAFTVAALRRVIDARASGRISGGAAEVYHVGNFTEDFELSQALLHTESTIRNLMNVRIQTAIKPTIDELHIQRSRWNRGITETLLEFGFTKFTRSMWIRWGIYIFSIATIPFSLCLMAERIASGVGFGMNAWMVLWLSVAAILALHKTITISRTRGIKNAFIAMLLIVEMPYDIFLHATFVRSLWHVVTSASKQWR